MPSNDVNIANAARRANNVVKVELKGANTLAHAGPNSGVISRHEIKYKIYPASGLNSAAFTESGGQVDLSIKEKPPGKVRSATLEVKVKATGASMVLCPAPFFFDKWELWPNDGTKDNVQRIFPESLIAYWAAINPAKFRALLPDLNMNENFWTNNVSIASGDSKIFRFPLLSDWFSMVQPNLQYIRGETILKLFTRNGIVVSGSGVPELQSVRLIFETEEHVDAVADYEESIYKGIVIKPYLNIQRIQPVAQTLTAGTQSSVSLENLSGACAGLGFCIRSSTSAASNGLLDFVDLGPDATIDIGTETNDSMLGMGSAIPADYFRTEVFSKHFSSDVSDKIPFYFIPFCENMSRALLGERNGFRKFNKDDKYLLYITPSGAGTAEVVTVDLPTGPNDAGYYALSLDGKVTNELVYNTSAANIKAALEGLDGSPFKEENGFTVTASDTAATDFTLTFSARANKLQGPPSKRFGVVKLLSTSLNDGGVACFASSSVTTAGKRGFTTGSYVVSVYAFMHRNAVINKGDVSFNDNI